MKKEVKKHCSLVGNGNALGYSSESKQNEKEKNIFQYTFEIMLFS